MSKRNKRKAVTDADQRAKRARGETDLGHDLHWTAEGDKQGTCPLLLCLSSDTLEGRQKIAGFDIDFTIIKTASGRKFAVGSNDWEFWHEEVPAKLKSLHNDGYRIVFFTNQAGIEKQKTTPEIFKTKIEAIIKALDIPVYVFASTGVNHFRKPYTAMWDYCLEKCNQGKKVNTSESLYVGDAAGRAKNWAPNKPKDFSCSDRMFAANINIKFYTPEELFLGERSAPFEWGSLDPDAFLKTNPIITKANDNANYVEKTQEMIVMVGPPASGKSTFRQRYLEPHGYVAVNRDTLGTAEKCLKVAGEAMKKGKNVVVDNTNPAKNARASFVELAKKNGVPCRCIWLQTPLDLAHHLNLYRQSQTLGKTRRVPDVGYNVFKKNFEEPSKSEGFTEVIKVPFKPRFDTSADEALFKKWTV
ncbi:hypothetical protein EGW08_003658 [Elysia chlorotica]|uniref:PNK FHA domain-containing protein n=1 Tax=Elysia chlorotica TaxID=188477 RepID=A0A433U441_ELYCH|nr:hypothetical protein EGW08_003658 [Elysia chlorotica]